MLHVHQSSAIPQDKQQAEICMDLVYLSVLSVVQHGAWKSPYILQYSRRGVPTLWRKLWSLWVSPISPLRQASNSQLPVYSLPCSQSQGTGCASKLGGGARAEWANSALWHARSILFFSFFFYPSQPNTYLRILRQAIGGPGPHNPNVEGLSPPNPNIGGASAPLSYYHTLYGASVHLYLLHGRD